MHDETPVLLYDGECGLCQRIVRVMLALDRAGRLRFAPLQGAPAQAYLRRHGLPTKDFDSLVFAPRGLHDPTPPFTRTDGALAAVGYGGWLGRLIATLRVLPRAWRDAAYRVIARWRYRLFGPPRPGLFDRPEWRSRFLAD
jgi:predicted DCC family thiol-disulfide oxidoreductase YuxK